MSLFSLEELKRTNAWGNMSPEERKSVESEYGVVDTTTPTLGERVLGNLQLGLGDAAAHTVGAVRFLTGLASDSQPGGVDSFGRTDINATLDTARKNIENYWGGFESAKKVAAHPAESRLGRIAEGVVRFAPEIPLWTAGEAPVSAGLRMLGGASKLGKVAKFASYLSEAPKGPIQEYLGVAARGGLTGAEVGAVTAKPGERLEKAGEEAVGFAIAAPVFHAAGKVVKAGLKYGFEKATPWLETQKDIGDIQAKYSMGTNESDQVIAFNTVLEAKKYAQENYTDRPWKVVKDKTTGKSFIGLDRPTSIPLTKLEEGEVLDDLPRSESLKVDKDRNVTREIDLAKEEGEYDIDEEHWIAEEERKIAEAEHEEGLVNEPLIQETEAKTTKVEPESIDKWVESVKAKANELATPTTERERFLQEFAQAYPGKPENVPMAMTLIDANAKAFGVDPEMYYAKLRANGPISDPTKFGSLDRTAQDGSMILSFYKKANIDTIVHESFHLFVGQMKNFAPELEQELIKLYELNKPALTKFMETNKRQLAKARANPIQMNEEYMAGLFTKWLRSPKDVPPEYTGVFQSFKNWLMEIFRTLKGTVYAEMKVSPEVDAFFRKITDTELKNVITKATTPKITKATTPKIKPSLIEYAPEEPSKSWENFVKFGKVPEPVKEKIPKVKVDKGTLVPETQLIDSAIREVPVRPESAKGLELLNKLKASKNPADILGKFTSEDLWELEGTKDGLRILNTIAEHPDSVSWLSSKQIDDYDRFKKLKAGPILDDIEPGYYGEYKTDGVMSLVDRLDKAVNDKVLYQKAPEALAGYAAEVAKVLASGREVSESILRQLKDVDPIFKEAYDAKRAKINKERQRERDYVVSQSAERAYDVMEGDRSKTKAEQYSAKVKAQFGTVLDKLKGVKGVEDSTFNFVAILQEIVSDGIRLLDDLVTASKYDESFKRAVIPADMEAISKLEGLTNMSLTPSEHLNGVIMPNGEHVGGILDIFRSAQLLLRRDPEALAKNRESSLQLLDTINKAYEQIVSWHQRINSADPNLFKEDQYIRMLRRGDGVIEDLWKTGLSTKNSFMWGIYKNLVSMHWAAKDWPVLQPMYNAMIDKLHQTTILSGDIIKGDLNNVVKFQGREVGLRGFEDFITLRDVDKQAYKITAELLWKGDKTKTDWRAKTNITGEKFFDLEQVRNKVRDEYVNEGLSEGQVEQIVRAYESVRETFDWMFGKTIDSLVSKAETPKRVDAVQKLLIDKLNYYEGYMPHLREGKWALGVFEKTREKVLKTPVIVDGTEVGYTEVPGSQPIEYHRSPNLPELRSIERQLREKYPNHNIRRLTPDEDASIATSARREAVGTIKSIFDEALGSPDIAKAKFAEEMLQRSIAELTDLGFFTHFKSRPGVDIPGYDERAGAVMLKTAQDFANFVSRQEFSEKGWGELAKLQRGGPGYGKIYNYASDWFDTMLQAGTGMDKVLARARSLIFLQTLGMNIKSSFITIAEKATNAPFVLGLYSKHGATENMKGMKDIVGYNKWKVEVNKHIKLMKKTNPDYSMHQALDDIGAKSGLNREELQAMYDLSHQGDLRAQYTEEMAGFAEARYDTIQDPLSSGLARAHDYVEKAMSGVSRIGSFLISNAERMGRESTGLAAFRIFRYEKGYSYEYAKDMAANLVRDIHYQYGKANQPTWMQKGVGKALKLALTFRTQEMNYINMLTHLWGSTGTEGRKAVIKSLGVLGALGGVSSLPFVYATNELFKKYYGTSPLEYVRQKINSGTDTEWLSSIVNDGGPAALGITVQPSLRVASDSSLTEALGGVSLSLGKQLWDAKSALGDRDYMTFLEKALPSAAANPLKAYDRWEYGAITGRGKALSDAPGEPPTKLNTYEAILNGFGFTPEKISRVQSKQGMRAADTAYWSGQRKTIYALINRGITKGNTDLVNRGFDKLSKYNQSAPPDKIIMPQAVLQSLQDRTGMKELLAETRLFGS
jgi:hypothetical protein